MEARKHAWAGSNCAPIQAETRRNVKQLKMKLALIAISFVITFNYDPIE